MSSVNVADSLLEDLICEDGNPDGPLEWDKLNESFTEFLERLRDKASPEDEVELTKDQEDEIIDRFDRKLQEYSGR